MRWAGRDGTWLGNWGVSRTIDCNLKFFFPGIQFNHLQRRRRQHRNLRAKNKAKRFPRLPHIPLLPLPLSPLSPPPLATKVGPDSNSLLWRVTCVKATQCGQSCSVSASVPCQRCRSTQTYMVYSHTHAHIRVCVCVHVYVFLCVLYVHMLRALLIARTIHYLLLSLSWKFVQLFSAALKSSATQHSHTHIRIHTPTHTPAHTLHKHTNLYSTLSCW